MPVVRILIAIVVLSVPSLLLADVDPAVEKKITAGLKKWQPAWKFNNFIETPIPGLYHVQVIGGPPLYVSEDGQYFIRGDLEKIGFGKTENWRDKVYAPMRRDLINAAEAEHMIAFKPKGKTKAVIYVFTDVDCGYCLKLHSEVPALNDMGVEVRYLAFPRAGVNSSSGHKLLSIWCADNPVEAMDRMKQRKGIAPKSCETAAISDHMRLVQEMGITGTPAVILEDGSLVSGYRRASQFRQILGL